MLLVLRHTTLSADPPHLCLKCRMTSEAWDLCFYACSHRVWRDSPCTLSPMVIRGPFERCGEAKGERAGSTCGTSGHLCVAAMGVHIRRPIGHGYPGKVKGLQSAKPYLLPLPWNSWGPVLLVTLCWRPQQTLQVCLLIATGVYLHKLLRACWAWLHIRITVKILPGLGVTEQQIPWGDQPSTSHQSDHAPSQNRNLKAPQRLRRGEHGAWACLESGLQGGLQSVGGCDIVGQRHGIMLLRLGDDAASRVVV